MTPAIRAAQAAGIEFAVLEYPHDDAAPSFGLEASHVLGLEPSTVFKTLVAEVDARQLVVALVPVDRTLDLKALAVARGGKRAVMADVVRAERTTGYVAGGISPLGQRKRLPTVVDRSALTHPAIHVSAGRRGLELRLRPDDLVRLCRATTAAIAR